jgi:hypothetical protein
VQKKVAAVSVRHLASLHVRLPAPLAIRNVPEKMTISNHWFQWNKIAAAMFFLQQLFS